MGKIETVLKSEIVRLARREVRSLTGKHGEELRRLRQRVAALEHGLRAMVVAAKAQQAQARIASVTAAATTDAGPKARLSPGLIRAIRRRLDLSQTELAKLVGVSLPAVQSWERGAKRPRPDTKPRIVVLRNLGRREVRRLLTEGRTVALNQNAQTAAAVAVEKPARGRKPGRGRKAAVAKAAGSRGRATGAELRRSGEQVRAVRAGLGLNQQKFAKLLGVSANAVGLWETGRMQPRAETRDRIAKLRGKRQS